PSSFSCHSSLSFSPILRPPSSTLFPYTTLFRSAAESSAASESEASELDVLSSDSASESTDSSSTESTSASDASLGSSSETSQVEDRKSTRLNSSHVSISYAVFCLKKTSNLARHL